MVPPKTDPRWKMIVTTDENLNFSALPTKMLMMRVRLLSKDKTPEKIQEAVDVAYDFFSKNSQVLANDLEILFGKDSKV